MLLDDSWHGTKGQNESPDTWHETTEAWVSAGLPVIRGKRSVIPIDRQMRIVAGSLVVLGAALYFIYPAFILLAAFVGCGLTFAGVTNICPMMNMLARMPWNQASGCGKCN